MEVNVKNVGKIVINFLQGIGITQTVLGGLTAVAKFCVGLYWSVINS